MYYSRIACGLAFLSGLLMASASHAGSERWIFTITPEQMLNEKLIHVQFHDHSGQAVESDALKEMIVRGGNCESGKIYAMPDDYKLGFSPEGKRIGLFIPQSTWGGKKLCFMLPSHERLEAVLPETETGRSISLTMGQP